MVNINFLYQITENKNLVYLLRDLMVGLTIGFTLYSIDSSKIKEAKEDEK